MTSQWLAGIRQIPIDWNAVEADFIWKSPMETCNQDPIHHGEGDVWTHTRMVADLIETQPSFLGTDVGVLTALFHDCAKLGTRTIEVEDGRERIRHPGHARRGAQASWHDLWALGVPLATRLEVYWLCAWHQRVFHMWEGDRDTMLRKAIEFGTVGRWDRLIAFARCDTRGRIAEDNPARLQDLELLEDWLREEGLLFGHTWPNPWSRFYFLEKAGRSHLYAAQEPQGSRATIMSGLPGSGKDTWITTNRHGQPVVSADGIREEFGIRPEDNQGMIVQVLRERMREHLRRKEPFVLNTTNLTRQMRQGTIGLCRDYDARVEIVALDRPPDIILRQNRERERTVPERVIRDLALKWEPPSLLEAHEVIWA
jgi:predicted kinase